VKGFVFEDYSLSISGALLLSCFGGKRNYHCSEMASTNHAEEDVRILGLSGKLLVANIFEVVALRLFSVAKECTVYTKGNLLRQLW